ncbi:MAG TPA: serine/threonine-protein kinase [Kofleriaceae bacterium]|nr:serine/threonine-protein kinase [Kofleriaceae bacterium]
MTDDGADGLGAAPTVRLHGAGDDGDGEMPMMVDRFVIEDELGAGGMGRVYVAYDPTLDRRVAVKVLRDRVGVDVEQAHARMAREARAMARLRHPHVVTVHEVGTDRHGLYIVMEYVAGGTLRGWLARTPASSWQEIVAMYVLAGRGLVAAHAAALVHRDFKPDNVLVGDDGRVLVGDFGIANVYGAEPAREPSSAEPGAERTRTGSVMGTPPYMSPEQHAGGAVDARTDQFAFCAALYEALYGVRPFAGETNTEIAERALRGELTPPARDPGAPARVRAAILRGLRGSPDQRFPSMVPLLAELTAERRAPLRWLAIAGAIAIVGAVASWAALGRSREPPAPALPRGPVAVEPFATTLAPGDRVDWREGIGDVVALLLSDIDGFKAVGPGNLLTADHAEDLRAAEARIGASYVVRGSLDPSGDRVHARVELVEPDGTTVSFQADRPAGELARLLEDVTNGVAGAIAPGHELDRSHAAIRARSLYAIGDEHLRDTRFQLAWPFLEQAVAADPTFFPGWYALALTRSWVLAPESRVFEAVAQARATAPSAVERALVDGLSSYLHHDLRGARAILEPLAANPALSRTELRDALYLLGEAHWHDGHHRIGVGYFRRALDLDMTFKLPVEHLGEYAMANRDVETMKQYSLMIASTGSEYHDVAEFVLGHYEQLAATGAPPTRLQATLVLGRTPTPQLEDELGADPIVHHIYRTARALEAGDSATAHAEIAEIWKQALARQTAGEIPDNVYYLLRLLGDVLVCGGMTDEAKRLVELLAERSREHPVRNYQRMSILTAPLVGDRAWIVRRELSDRDAQLADAIEAEMTGDHARAAELLGELVRDPSPFWDYPERMALVRNLRALHRTEDARAVCEDTLHPAVFQLALLPARRFCTGP